MSNDKHVCTIYIKAEAARIWEALTAPEFTRRFTTTNWRNRSGRAK